MMEKTIRDYIKPTENFVGGSVAGFSFWVVWEGDVDVPDGQSCKTYHKDYDGYIQPAFNVIPCNKASEFVIEHFQNADGTDFHFEWYDIGDELFAPCFAVYDKETCFDGDLVDGWVFYGGQWVKRCQFSVGVDRLSDAVRLSKVQDI